MTYKKLRAKRCFFCTILGREDIDVGLNAIGYSEHNTHKK